MATRNEAAQELVARIPLSITDIQEILPHRYPFLMLDRVTEFVEGEKVVGIKNVSANEPFFAGHFPGRPIMPGVMMLEALAQLGAIFAHLSADGAAPGTLIVFSGAEDVRFRRLVVPGDVLRLEMQVIRKKLTYWKMHGIATVDGEVAVDAILSAAEMPNNGSK